MSLFGDLPPPSTKNSDITEGGKKTSAAESGKDEVGASKRTWAAPAFAPVLRRHKAAKPSANAAVRSAFPANEDNDDSKQVAPNGPAVGRRSDSRVQPTVPLLNPKHPHSLPHDPASLISKWADVASENEVKQQPMGVGGGSAKALSLAEYMPGVPRHKTKGKGIANEADFVPFEEYNPAYPNNYQTYRRWIEREKQLRIQRAQQQQQRRQAEEGQHSDANEEHYRSPVRRRDAGEPSRLLMLTNMADEIDDLLEKETMEECEAYGAVLRCVASVADQGKEEELSAFERIQVLVEFEDIEAAVRAREALDQRFFDGRHISATFLPSQD
ncbi:hypothetical protein GQ54DRAFT_41471 [Martensiomyces pterosporus]|nr:hypothetical protein GQ54DRAFT_41471 [Martensiomyces pterosporus]